MLCYDLFRKQSLMTAVSQSSLLITYHLYIVVVVPDTNWKEFFLYIFLFSLTINDQIPLYIQYKVYTMCPNWIAPFFLHLVLISKIGDCVGLNNSCNMCCVDIKISLLIILSISLFYNHRIQPFRIFRWSIHRALC